MYLVVFERFHDCLYNLGNLCLLTMISPFSLQASTPSVMPSVALSLLAQVFLIIHHKPLARRLMTLLLGTYKEINASSLPDSALHPSVVRFVEPEISLAEDYIHGDDTTSTPVTVPGTCVRVSCGNAMTGLGSCCQCYIMLRSTHGGAGRE